MSLIADIVLVVHFCIVVFIVVGFFLIPIGYKYGWTWIKNTKLRILHLALMALVTLEALFGITCPLTFIENSLRGIYQQKSFIGYWIGQIIYWDFPTQFFMILYCIAAGWTILMWKLFPITYNQKN
ncbi:MAG TPA: DUF2784 domain-containing protein [Rhodospirillales bacterium]|nr:DUF2784 domain-containing protein [Rhodospirillales bacterium]HIL76134.1 DUF2784 domain-containing protein [Rhodospirillales bacterium]